MFTFLLLAVGCSSTLPPLSPTAAPTISLHLPTDEPIRSVSPQISTPSRIPTATRTGTSTPDSNLSTDAAKQGPQSAPADVCSGSAGRLDVSYLDSSVLKRRIPYSLYLPPCYGTDRLHRYSALYLLHGANTDHTQWPDLNVHPDADPLIAGRKPAPSAVVMPGGDYRTGEDYGAFVLQELIPHVEQTLQVAHDGPHRAIGGLSQGGYWALELAIAHPDLFDAVGGHSPAISSALSNLLASLHPAALDSLRIYLDVGNQDSLAPGVSAFVPILQAYGLAPIFHVYPGGHTRPYWRSHTSEYLQFYAASW